MRKKNKQCCSCTQEHESCNICEKAEHECKPVKECKPTKQCTKPVKQCSKPCIKPVKKYVECGCDGYDAKFEDNCVHLAKKAEELFEKALECECKAKESLEQAQDCEKSAKILTAKASKLLKNANCTEKEAKAAECTAKELMEKAEKLCQQAKCLYKEADKIEKEAECHCEKAKCLYEKYQEHNDMAKQLYNQAMKCNEKSLECYKSVGEKIKEYEVKSKKCEDMMHKCNTKIGECGKKVKPEQNTTCKKYVNCDMHVDCECEEYKPVIEPKMKGCNKKEMMYDKECDLCSKNMCSTYVTPMYDMAPMQQMGSMCNQYPSLDMPYMNPYMDQYQDANDMWMNYYMMMQSMMMQNMNPNYKM